MAERRPATSRSTGAGQSETRKRTRAPYQCCGAPSRWLRPVQSVCPECVFLIEAGRKALQQQEKAQQESDGQFRRPRYFSGFYGPAEVDKVLRCRLDQVFWELVRRITAPVLGGKSSNERLIDSQDECTEYVTANRALRRCVNELDVTIRLALADSYAGGLERGNNLLLGLATGKFTAEQITAETMKADAIAHPLRCPVCRIEFQDKTSFVRHIHRDHRDQKPRGRP